MSTEPQDVSVLSKKISKRRYLILTVTSILGAVVLKMSFLFLFIAMLPAMLAYLVDLDKRKYIFSTVATLNFAGAFPYMMDILSCGGSFEAIKYKLTDGMVWVIMYGSAAIGWGMVWISPVMTAGLLKGVYQTRMAYIENEQEKAVKMWGEEVMGRKVEVTPEKESSFNTSAKIS